MNASKQVLIFSPPPVLTLHLKRFQQVTTIRFLKRLTGLAGQVCQSEKYSTLLLDPPSWCARSFNCKKKKKKQKNTTICKNVEKEMQMSAWRPDWHHSQLCELAFVLCLEATGGGESVSTMTKTKEAT